MITDCGQHKDTVLTSTDTIDLNVDQIRIIVGYIQAANANPAVIESVSRVFLEQHDV